MLLEKKGGAPPVLNAMNDFCSCIMDFGLIDVDFKVLPYTWQWREVHQRLDRVLFNQDWIDMLDENRVVHGVRRLFDHRPLLISSEVKILIYKVAPFKF